MDQTDPSPGQIEPHQIEEEQKALQLASDVPKTLRIDPNLNYAINLLAYWLEGNIKTLVKRPKKLVKL